MDISPGALPETRASRDLQGTGQTRFRKLPAVDTEMNLTMWRSTCSQAWREWWPPSRLSTFECQRRAKKRNGELCRMGSSMNPQGCCNKIPCSGWPKPRNCLIPQFWRREFWHQGVHGDWPFYKLWGRSLFQASPLSLEMTTCMYTRHSPCILVSFQMSLLRDIGHTGLQPTLMISL